MFSGKWHIELALRASNERQVSFAPRRVIGERLRWTTLADVPLPDLLVHRSV